MDSLILLWLLAYIKIVPHFCLENFSFCGTADSGILILPLRGKETHWFIKLGNKLQWWVLKMITPAKNSITSDIGSVRKRYQYHWKAESLSYSMVPISLSNDCISKVYGRFYCLFLTTFPVVIQCSTFKYHV